MALTSKITRKGQTTIPEAIRDTLGLKEGDVLQFELAGRRIMVVPLTLVPADQAWFWTKEHQQKEQEADEDLKAGRYKEFISSKALIRDLRRGAKRKKTQ